MGRRRPWIRQDDRLGGLSTGPHGTGGTPLNDGGIYDPATDSWTALPTKDAPSPRSSHYAVWTGDRMIVWGGLCGTAYCDAAAFLPSTSSWQKIPSPQIDPIGAFAAWTGKYALAWNLDHYSMGMLYDPTRKLWGAITQTDAPTGPTSHDSGTLGGLIVGPGQLAGRPRRRAIGRCRVGAARPGFKRVLPTCLSP